MQTSMAYNQPLISWLAASSYEQAVHVSVGVVLHEVHAEEVAAL